MNQCCITYVYEKKKNTFLLLNFCRKSNNYKQNWMNFAFKETHLSYSIIVARWICFYLQLWLHSSSETTGTVTLCRTLGSEMPPSWVKNKSSHWLAVSPRVSLIGWQSGPEFRSLAGSQAQSITHLLAVRPRVSLIGWQSGLEFRSLVGSQAQSLTHWLAVRHSVSLIGWPVNNMVAAISGLKLKAHKLNKIQKCKTCSFEFRFKTSVLSR